MSFQLTGLFSNSFYNDLLKSIPDLRQSKNFEDMVKDVFHADPEKVFISDDVIFEKCLETDTVSNITSPVEVWIDPEGIYTVKVHEREDNNEENN